MIVRDYSAKEVMVISDYPLLNEEKRGVPYSEASSISFKDALGAASYLECKSSTEKHLLNSSTVCFTYLSLSRPMEGDFDWGKSIVSKRSIPAGETYYQLEWLKDVWVSDKIRISIDSLIKQVKDVQPKLIVLAGKWAFMFLASLFLEPSKQLSTIAITKSTPTSKKMFGGLNKFRSSVLVLNEHFGIDNVLVVPILTPSFLFLVKEKEFAVKRDYAKITYFHRRLQSGIDVMQLLKSRRVANVGLNYEDVMLYLSDLYNKLEQEPVLVAMDIETRQGYTDCIGLAYDEYESFTIPFSEMYNEVNTNPDIQASVLKSGKEVYQTAPIGAELTRYRSYWSLEEELKISTLLWQVMLHPNCKHIGQNYNYDCQYYHHQWKLRINAHCDSMIIHHVLHNMLQKDLATLASIYCMDYVYWKDEIEVKDNLTRWMYNGKDCCYTLSIAKLLLKLMERQDSELQNFYNFQQHEVSPNIVSIMNRGVRIDALQKDALNVQFTALMEGCVEKINYIFMEEVNLNSTPQVKKAFKELLGITPILNRKTKRESFGSEAMLVYLEEYPQWRTLLTLFLEYKSIKVFVRTFLSAKLDNDGRMRCDYNPAGTKTYRLSSRKNVFGNGMNLANVPSHGKIDLRVALLEITSEEENAKDIVEVDDSELMQFQTEVGNLYKGTTVLPNVKKIFLPDNDDWFFFDADYSAIDLHFVVWEADCAYLKNIMKTGGDVYSVLASDYYQRPITKNDDERQIFKAICHGCLTGEHEVLTPDGWVKLADLQEEVPIAIWGKPTRNIKFEVPEGINKDFVEADEPLYEIKGDAFHQICTQDHTFPYTTDKLDNLRSTQAITLPKSARLPYNGEFIGGNIRMQLEYMQLIAALQADGNIAHIAQDGTVTYRFKFVKERKIVRLRTILKALKVQYKEWKQTDNSATNGNIRTCFSFKNVLKPEMEKLSWWILDYSETCINAWLDELPYWDGHVRTKNGVRTSISTTDAHAAEVIQTVAHLCGKGSKLTTKERDVTRKTIYEVSLNNRLFHNMGSGSTQLIQHTGTYVYCPKTSSGFFMVRYNGHVMVTGNSNYLGKAGTLAAKAGLSMARVKKVQDQYFRVCPEIPEWHRRVESEARSNKFVRNIFGAKFWNYDFNDPMWLNKVVAAIPQSSAAILVNKALCELERVEQGKNIQVLLQVHDSLAGQARKSDTGAIERILGYMAVEIPYKDKLVIPAALKTSSISYGNCG
jgi:DNA polymerase I-like protein with 3'-5' exonuclease and polymerase domains